MLNPEVSPARSLKKLSVRLTMEFIQEVFALQKQIDEHLSTRHHPATLSLDPLRPRPGVPQQKRGKLLQVMLIQRPGGVYTNDRFMQVLFRAEVPIIEIIGSGNLLMTIYNGKSFIYRISIRNAGQVELKDFQSVISHPGSSQIHSSQSATVSLVCHTDLWIGSYNCIDHYQIVCGYSQSSLQQVE